jgi:hypothetical protein
MILRNVSKTKWWWYNHIRSEPLEMLPGDLCTVIDTDGKVIRGSYSMILLTRGEVFKVSLNSQSKLNCYWKNYLEVVE